MAEDITQATWLRAVDDWDRNGLPDRPGAWLSRVASRLLSNHWRHEAVEQVTEDDPDAFADDDDRSERRGQRSMVQRALEGDLANARLAVIQAQGQLMVLAEQMKLRDEFLQHGTPPAQLVQRSEAAQLRADAAYSAAELTAARALLALVEKSRASGVANDDDLLRAQLAVNELEAEVQRLAARLHPTE